MYIDTVAGSYIANGKTLSGWAVSMSGISKVVVDVYTSGGEYLGEYNASYGGVKTSVKNVYTPANPTRITACFHLTLAKWLPRRISIPAPIIALT